MRKLLISLSALLGLVPAAFAEDADTLSQQLSNPLADLISVPFQNNFDFGAGPDGDGFGCTMNIQPVIPISLNDDWNIIARTILPIGYRDHFPGGTVSGLGDTTQSLFLSPKSPGPGGLIWGVGPVILLPTATEDFLGRDKWGLGPTGVALVQKGPWTIGALANHIWSVAGDDDRAEVNLSYFQPFVSYAFGGGRSLALNTESSYDWDRRQWNVPLNLMYSQVMNLGAQPVSLQFGGRYYAEAPANGPEWGLRATLTLLFPKK